MKAVAVDDAGLAGEPERELIAGDRALAPRPRVVGERIGLIGDAAYDQLQRLTGPARHAVARLGQLGAIEPFGRRPRPLLDALQPTTSPESAAPRSRSAP